MTNKEMGHIEQLRNALIIIAITSIPVSAWAYRTGGSPVEMIVRVFIIEIALVLLGFVLGVIFGWLLYRIDRTANDKSDTE